MTTSTPLAHLADAFQYLPHTREILLADAGLDDLQVLLDGLRPGVEVRLLQATDDLVAHLLAALAEPALQTLHLLGHGAPGQLIFGGRAVKAHDFCSRYDGAAQRNLEIAFWSCHTGAGEAGQAFVQAVAAATGARVVAAAGLIGDVADGWALDGTIGAPFNEVACRGFRHTLATATSLAGTINGTSYDDLKAALGGINPVTSLTVTSTSPVDIDLLHELRALLDDGGQGTGVPIDLSGTNGLSGMHDHLKGYLSTGGFSNFDALDIFVTDPIDAGDTTQLATLVSLDTDTTGLVHVTITGTANQVYSGLPSPVGNPVTVVYKIQLTGESDAFATTFLHLFTSQKVDVTATELKGTLQYLTQIFNDSVDFSGLDTVAVTLTDSDDVNAASLLLLTTSGNIIVEDANTLTGTAADLIKVVGSKNILLPSYPELEAQGDSSVADLLALQANPAFHVHAKVLENDVNTLVGLVASGVMQDYTITIKDPSANAQNLMTIAGSTSEPVNASAVMLVTGSAAWVDTFAKSTFVKHADPVSGHANYNVSLDSATGGDIAVIKDIAGLTDGYVAITATASDLAGLITTNVPYPLTVLGDTATTAIDPADLLQLGSKANHSADASDLLKLEGWGTGTIDGSTHLETITGTSSDLATLLGNSQLNSQLTLHAGVSVVVTNSAPPLADILTIIQHAPGPVIAGTGSPITVSAQELLTLPSGGQAPLYDNQLAFKLTGSTGSTARAADLQALDALTTLPVDATIIGNVSGEPAALKAVAVAAAGANPNPGITLPSDVGFMIDQAYPELSASVLSDLHAVTGKTINAGAVSQLSGSLSDLQPFAVDTNHTIAIFGPTYTIQVPGTTVANSANASAFNSLDSLPGVNMLATLSGSATALLQFYDHGNPGDSANDPHPANPDNTDLYDNHANQYTMIVTDSFIDASSLNQLDARYGMVVDATSVPQLYGQASDLVTLATSALAGNAAGVKLATDVAIGVTSFISSTQPVPTPDQIAAQLNAIAALADGYGNGKVTARMSLTPEAALALQDGKGLHAYTIALTDDTLTADQLVAIASHTSDTVTLGSNKLQGSVAAILAALDTPHLAVSAGRSPTFTAEITTGTIAIPTDDASVAAELNKLESKADGVIAAVTGNIAQLKTVVADPSRDAYTFIITDGSTPSVADAGDILGIAANSQSTDLSQISTVTGSYANVMNLLQSGVVLPNVLSLTLDAPAGVDQLVLLQNQLALLISQGKLMSDTITATVIEGDVTNLLQLVDNGNLQNYTISVTDSSASARDLLKIAATSLQPLKLANLRTLTGTAADVISVLQSAHDRSIDLSGLTAVLPDNLDPNQLAALDAATGNINAALHFTASVSGTAAQLTDDKSGLPVAHNHGLNSVTVTVNDSQITLLQLEAIAAATSVLPIRSGATMVSDSFASIAAAIGNGVPALTNFAVVARSGSGVNAQDVLTIAQAHPAPLDIHGAGVLSGTLDQVDSVLTSSNVTYHPSSSTRGSFTAVISGVLTPDAPTLAGLKTAANGSAGVKATFSGSTGELNGVPTTSTDHFNFIITGDKGTDSADAGNIMSVVAKPGASAVTADASAITLVTGTAAEVNAFASSAIVKYQAGGIDAYDVSLTAASSDDLLLADDILGWTSGQVQVAVSGTATRLADSLAPAAQNLFGPSGFTLTVLSDPAATTTAAGLLSLVSLTNNPIDATALPAITGTSADLTSLFGGAIQPVPKILVAPNAYLQPAAQVTATANGGFDSANRVFVTPGIQIEVRNPPGTAAPTLAEIASIERHVPATITAGSLADPIVGTAAELAALNLAPSAFLGNFPSEQDGLAAAFAANQANTAFFDSTDHMLYRLGSSSGTVAGGTTATGQAAGAVAVAFYLPGVNSMSADDALALLLHDNALALKVSGSTPGQTDLTASAKDLLATDAVTTLPLDISVLASVSGSPQDLRLVQDAISAGSMRFNSPGTSGSLVFMDTTPPPPPEPIPDPLPADQPVPLDPGLIASDHSAAGADLLAAAAQSGHPVDATAVGTLALADGDIAALAANALSTTPTIKLAHDVTINIDSQVGPTVAQINAIASIAGSVKSKLQLTPDQALQLQGDGVTDHHAYDIALGEGNLSGGQLQQIAGHTSTKVVLGANNFVDSAANIVAALANPIVDASAASFTATFSGAMKAGDLMQLDGATKGQLDASGAGAIGGSAIQVLGALKVSGLPDGINFGAQPHAVALTDTHIDAGQLTQLLAAPEVGNISLTSLQQLSGTPAEIAQLTASGKISIPGTLDLSFTAPPSIAQLSAADQFTSGALSYTSIVDTASHFGNITADGQVTLSPYITDGTPVTVTNTDANLQLLRALDAQNGSAPVIGGTNLVVPNDWGVLSDPDAPVSVVGSTVVQDLFDIEGDQTFHIGQGGKFNLIGADGENTIVFDGYRAQDLQVTLTGTTVHFMFNGLNTDIASISTGEYASSQTITFGAADSTQPGASMKLLFALDAQGNPLITLNGVTIPDQGYYPL